MSNRYKVEIEGVAPMLMHSPEVLKEEKQGRSSGKHDPETDARKALYTDNDGNIVVPSRAIEGAMREASKDFPMGGKGGKKSYKEYIMAGAMVDPNDVPLQSTNGLSPQDSWEIDLMPVVIQKARIIRSRPRFDEWKLEFEVQLLDPVLDPKIVEEILVAAGKYKGLLDHRPKFGRFKVNKFEAVSE